MKFLTPKLFLTVGVFAISNCKTAAKKTNEVVTKSPSSGSATSSSVSDACANIQHLVLANVPANSFHWQEPQLAYKEGQFLVSTKMDENAAFIKYQVVYQDQKKSIPEDPTKMNYWPFGSFFLPNMAPGIIKLNISQCSMKQNGAEDCVSKSYNYNLQSGPTDQTLSNLYSKLYKNYQDNFHLALQIYQKIAAPEMGALAAKNPQTESMVFNIKTMGAFRYAAMLEAYAQTDYNAGIAQSSSLQLTDDTTSQECITNAQMPQEDPYSGTDPSAVDPTYVDQGGVVDPAASDSSFSDPTLAGGGAGVSGTGIASPTDPLASPVTPANGMNSGGTDSITQDTASADSSNSGNTSSGGSYFKDHPGDDSSSVGNDVGGAAAAAAAVATVDPSVPPLPTTPSSAGRSGLSAGGTAGVVIGSLAVFAGVALGVWVYKKGPDLDAARQASPSTPLSAESASAVEDNPTHKHSPVVSKDVSSPFATNTLRQASNSSFKNKALGGIKKYGGAAALIAGGILFIGLGAGLGLTDGSDESIGNQVAELMKKHLENSKAREVISTEIQARMKALGI